jgi:hypothetical protein
MEFGEIKDAVMLGLMFVVFGVPALAIAARIAIRPVLDAVNSFREVAGRPTTPDPRLAELEAEVTRLGREVNRLAEAEAFNRQLGKGASPEVTRE